MKILEVEIEEGQAKHDAIFYKWEDENGVVHEQERLVSKLDRKLLLFHFLSHTKV